MDVPKMKQLSDLPSSLVTDILLRLPLETLLSCRYVCTAWDGFFTDPEFAELQLAASPIHFLQRDVEEDRAIHFGTVVKVDGKLQAQTVDFTPRGLDLPDPTYRCVNSSNGLLCLVGRHDGSISVCNPLLGQSVSLPDPRVKNCLGHKSVAIGFSAKDKLYKVLVGYQLKDQDQDYGYEIYTLGTREWRAIDTDVGCRPWDHSEMDFNTFLHGSLHWISVALSTDAGSRVRSLWSFNFETEKFQRLELPEAGGDSYNEDYYIAIDDEYADDYAQVGIMNGYLWVCFCCNDSPDDSDFWVMKEYGVKESWTQILSFREYYSHLEILCPSGFIMYGYNGNNSGDVTCPRLLFSFSHKDVLITEEEDPGKSHSVHVEKVLIGDGDGDLICYNTNKPRQRFVKFNTGSSHTYDFRYVNAYVPSFVSLQDVAKGEEVKVSRITYEAAQ